MVNGCIDVGLLAGATPAELSMDAQVREAAFARLAGFLRGFQGTLLLNVPTPETELPVVMNMSRSR